MFTNFCKYMELQKKQTEKVQKSPIKYFRKTKIQTSNNTQET